MSITPEQLQAMMADPQMREHLQGLVDTAAAAIEDGNLSLMELLARDHPVGDDVVTGSFEQLTATLEPRWGRLMRWVAAHLATRIPGQGEAVPKALLEWALGMFTAELAANPEQMRSDVLLLVRKACAELEVTSDEIYAGDGTVLPVPEEQGDTEEVEHGDG
ncbi:MAG TPA: hypothetical protein VFC09_09735 [Candidatus Dormibacteraeota bacterium]|nr:hypothetical protein [Candidatus Dormibacteraeota bacterium]